MRLQKATGSLTERVISSTGKQASRFSWAVSVCWDWELGEVAHSTSASHILLNTAGRGRDRTARSHGKLNQKSIVLNRNQITQSHSPDNLRCSVNHSQSESCRSKCRNACSYQEWKITVYNYTTIRRYVSHLYCTWILFGGQCLSLFYLENNALKVILTILLVCNRVILVFLFIIIKYNIALKMIGSK